MKGRELTFTKTQHAAMKRVNSTTTDTWYIVMEMVAIPELEETLESWKRKKKQKRKKKEEDEKEEKENE